MLSIGTPARVMPLARSGTASPRSPAGICGSASVAVKNGLPLIEALPGVSMEVENRWIGARTAYRATPVEATTLLSRGSDGAWRRRFVCGADCGVEKASIASLDTATTPRIVAFA